MNKKISSTYTFDELCEALALAPILKPGLIPLFIPFFIFFGVLSFIVGIRDAMPEMKLCGYILICFSLMMVVLLVISTPKIKKKLFLKKTKKANSSFSDGISYEYEFNDDSVTIKSYNGPSNSTQIIKYINITKLACNDSDTYIFINNYNCYVFKTKELTLDELFDFAMRLPTKSRKECIKYIKKAKLQNK